MQTLHFDDLPIAAQQGFSFDQLLYIDEFSFVLKEGLIEAHYAGECLAVWDDVSWQYPLF